MITIVRAPPFATIQDGGRFGYQSQGVPRSGFADRASARIANILLQNPFDSALVEIAVGGGAFRFERDAAFAITGATFDATVRGERVGGSSKCEVRAGDELVIARIIEGRFLYLAVRGGIGVPEILESRSTLLSATLGGFHGRRLANGDRLPIGAASRHETAAPHRTIRMFQFAVLRGPQWDLFDGESRERFMNTTFRVSQLSDRTGYRLEGGTFTSLSGASMLSEPTCAGAIQVPGGGSPIVLMPDGPTIGGYPKIAVLRDAGLDSFAQLVPGESVRFSMTE